MFVVNNSNKYNNQSAPIEKPSALNALTSSVKRALTQVAESFSTPVNSAKTLQLTKKELKALGVHENYRAELDSLHEKSNL